MNSITKAKDRIDNLADLMNEMIEMGRMRSDFALRQFVIGQHDTPGRQRAQALAELQSLYFAMADLYDDMAIEQMDHETEKLSHPHPTPRQRIERRKRERKILSYEIQLTQRVKEIDCLLQILDELPKYTAEQYEKEEPVYWAARLARQAFMAGRDPGGNLDAMLQLATIPGKQKPITPVSPEQFLKSLGVDAVAIADGLLYSGIISEEGRQLMIEMDTQEKAALAKVPVVHHNITKPRKRKH